MGTTDRPEAGGYMSRMPTELSDRRSLFLHVLTHPQLQYYFNLRETHRAANESGLFVGCGSP
jgi:hypothetical protein